MGFIQQAIVLPFGNCYSMKLDMFYYYLLRTDMLIFSHVLLRDLSLYVYTYLNEEKIQNSQSIHFWSENKDC